MNYYDEVNSYVKKVEIGKAIRETNANRELVECYWNVGRLIVEAQGGKEKAKYGNELIRNWSKKLSNDYGKGYSYENLFKFRKFYLTFPIVDTLCPQLTWSIIRTLLPIVDINKRNYYINLCIENKLSVRELKREIKSNSYERLEHKPDKIDIVVPTKVPAITNNFKNPILLKLKDKEIKCRKLKKEDKGQVEFYMNLVDNFVKEPSNNPTIGIIITKDQDKFVANFVRSEKVVPLIYELVN